MTGGYRVDPDELTAFAGRLDESAEEVRAAAAARRSRWATSAPKA